jgi:hypothetical protein
LTETNLTSAINFAEVNFHPTDFHVILNESSIQTLSGVWCGPEYFNYIWFPELKMVKVIDYNIFPVHLYKIEYVLNMLLERLEYHIPYPAELIEDLKKEHNVVT